MYLRTPRRYSRGGRRRNYVNTQWLWLWLLTPVIVLVGVFIYNNQEDARAVVGDVVGEVIDTAQNAAATIGAPTAVPTQDPGENLARASEAWQRGAIQEAVETYRQIISAVPNDLPVHYQYTLGLVMQDRDREALAAAEDTVTANPFSPDAWSIRAMAQARSGSYGQAVASAQRALELAPQNEARDNPAVAQSRARALAFLAEAYFYDEQYERAETTVEEALALDPDSFEAYYVRGLVNWIYNIDRDAAMEDFQTAYNLVPNMIYIGVEMTYLDGEIQLARQNQGETPDYTQAIDRVEGILEVNPDHTRSLFWLGDYYLRIQGEPNQASDYLARCAASNPDYAPCHYLLGRARRGQENFTDALLSYQAAIQTAQPGDSLLARYYYWSAEAQLQLTNLSACLASLQQAVEIAQEIGDQVVLDAYATLSQQCGAFVAQPTPTPEATAEPAGDV
ncbi:MAG: tetratricopeptide repeat protein [bacterium]|nr:tetratricopeptide repeat protein [bacterium]